MDEPKKTRRKRGVRAAPRTKISYPTENDIEMFKLLQSMHQARATTVRAVLGTEQQYYVFRCRDLFDNQWLWESPIINDAYQPLVLSLDQKGFDALEQRGERIHEYDTFHGLHNKGGKRKTKPHTVHISDTLACAMMFAQKHNFTFIDTHEAIKLGSVDSLQMKARWATQGRERHHIEPDRIIGFQKPDGKRIFVSFENDTGSMSVERVVDKYLGYNDMYEKESYKAHGLPNMLVLTITCDVNRMNKIMQEFKKRADKNKLMTAPFLFTHLPTLHAWANKYRPSPEIFENYIARVDHPPFSFLHK